MQPSARRKSQRGVRRSEAPRSESNSRRMKNGTQFMGLGQLYLPGKCRSLPTRGSPTFRISTGRLLLDWRVRRLIVNADDFGFTAGVNRAIVEAHTRGIVTSSTLMANGRAFDDAVGLAKTVPRLSVGCHVVLIDGEPVFDAACLPSLSVADSGGARFRDGLISFAFRAMAGRLDPGEIEAEARAQIRK